MKYRPWTDSTLRFGVQKSGSLGKVSHCNYSTFLNMEIKIEHNRLLGRGSSNDVARQTPQICFRSVAGLLLNLTRSDHQVSLQ